MNDDPTRDLVLDGNAAAGALVRVFGDDVTGLDEECAACHTVAKVGALVAYTRCPGVVLRCRACSNVVVRVVETPRGTFVDARGVRLRPR